MAVLIAHPPFGVCLEGAPLGFHRAGLDRRCCLLGIPMAGFAMDPVSAPSTSALAIGPASAGLSMALLATFQGVASSPCRALYVLLASLSGGGIHDREGDQPSPCCIKGVSRYARIMGPFMCIQAHLEDGC